MILKRTTKLKLERLFLIFESAAISSTTILKAGTYVVATLEPHEDRERVPDRERVGRQLRHLAVRGAAVGRSEDVD